MLQQQPTIVCVASYFKGADFLRECRRQGWRVVLLTREKLHAAAWPFDSLDELLTLPDHAEMEAYLHAASDFARTHQIQRLVALEEADVITAARIREFLCLPGMDATTALNFRDKLAMRVRGRESGLTQPAFVHLLNDREVGEFMERVPPPWVVKPRADASAIGITRLHSAEEVWHVKAALDARAELRERSAYYLLESSIAGAVYHVDALTVAGKVVFAGVNRYGRPPLEIVQHGGVATSFTVPYDAAERAALLRLNETLLLQFGLRNGASHAEFIQSTADGQFYFLEVAARVGGAYTTETHEAATGFNLWREWARCATATDAQPYQLPPLQQNYSGLLVTLARQEWPDTSAYDDPEIVYRVAKPWHAGLIVQAPQSARVQEFLARYELRFQHDFTATAPQPERPE
ncbi:MAG: ATP-grasp domain-containing protein [Acidobacteria bacterium]|nr:ATP-grasp domain-containing protein [Acidobacteriota bacterium]MBI3427182.1 ATP-grasp domain-containing protein [Acidobacteriota bacterium]